VLPENVYNINETEVMLYMLNSVKVLINKNDPRDYKGVGVKQTIVIIIKYISISDKSLLLIIIWPAITYQSN
jgi:hypothetical protein